MRKRMLWMLAAVLVFIGGIGLVKYFQIRTAIAQGKSWSPPPEAVTTVVAATAEWPAMLTAIGSVEAVQGVTLSADLPGIVESIPFDSGHRVGKGEVLVRLDTRQEQAQLAASEAARDLAKLNLERGQKLRERDVIAQAELDQFAASAKEAEARVGEIRASIARKTIRAPFAGVLGIRQVDVGQYLNAGEPIVSLQTMDPVYVNFSVPQDDVHSLRTGAEVRVSADSDAVARSTGRITAINSVLDAATRNIQVQATFRNPHAALRPGMFVDVQVLLGRSSKVIALPASAVNYAPYGNSVFIVEQMTDPKNPKSKPYKGVRQQFVKLGATRGDLVAVTDGVKPGQEVVTSGVFKLRSGASVQVNNETKPSANAAPKPADT